MARTETKVATAAATGVDNVGDMLNPPPPGLFWGPVLMVTLYHLTPLVLHPGDPVLWTVLTVPTFLALAVLPLRHTRPGPVVVVVLLCLAVSPAAAGATAGLVGSRARRATTRGAQFRVGGLVMVAAVVTLLRLLAQGWVPASTVELVISQSIITGAGLVGLLANFASDSRAAREETEEYRAVQIRMDERVRLAREMHDVVAHRVSLVAMMSGALAYRDDLPTDVRDAVTVIQDNSRQALDELRAVLADLRSGDDPEAPQPTLGGLPVLLDEARSAGTHVDARIDVPVETLPLTHSRHLYRIIQEGLTNARRHAPGQPVTVDLVGDPTTGLTLRLSNPAGPATGYEPGYGLVGVEERARLLGGTSRTRQGDGRFTLEVSVPWKVA